MKMCPECHACGGPDGVTNCATCRGDFWTRDAGSQPDEVGTRRSGPTEIGENGCTGYEKYQQYHVAVGHIKALETALKEALAIFRQMEKPPGVDGSRTQAWRREAHGLLHPNDYSTAQRDSQP